jgi:hypothetical protein
MKPSLKMLLAFELIAIAVALCAPAPDASSEHYVVTNDNNLKAINSGTVLKAGGTSLNPTLKVIATLATMEQINAYSTASPMVQVITHGSDICVFLSDSEDTGNFVSAFVYPNLSLVGNYTDGAGGTSADGAALAAHGDYLFASYIQDLTGAIGVWQIGTGCTLTLSNTYPIPGQVYATAVTPDGKTLLVAYSTLSDVDSFSIGSGGALTEHGPYGLYNALYAVKLDITADSKYALFDARGYGSPPNGNAYTQVNAFPINSDGSLGTQSMFGGDESLGLAPAAGWFWLSPNGKFLYSVSQDYVNTLNITETPTLDITYSGCATTLRSTTGSGFYSGAIATALPTGTGGALYIPEWGNPDDDVAMLTINSTTGCTTEVKQSPFPTGQNGDFFSLAAWPARPF